MWPRICGEAKRIYLLSQTTIIDRKNEAEAVAFRHGIKLLHWRDYFANRSGRHTNNVQLIYYAQFSINLTSQQQQTFSFTDTFLTQMIPLVSIHFSQLWLVSTVNRLWNHTYLSGKTSTAIVNRNLYYYVGHSALSTGISLVDKEG